MFDYYNPQKNRTANIPKTKGGILMRKYSNHQGIKFMNLFASNQRGEI